MGTWSLWVSHSLLKSLYELSFLYLVQSHLPRPPNVPLLGALWYLVDGIWGLLKGSWGGWYGLPCKFGALMSDRGLYRLRAPGKGTNPTSC